MRKSYTFIFILVSTTFFSKPIWAISHQFLDLLESRFQWQVSSSESQDDEEACRSNYEILSTWPNRDLFLSHLIDDNGIDREKALRYFANKTIGEKRRSRYDRIYSEILSDLFVTDSEIQHILDQYIDADSDAHKLLKLSSTQAGKRAMLDGYYWDENKNYFKYLSTSVLKQFKNERDWYDNISSLLATEVKDQKNIEWLLENTEFSRNIIKLKFPQANDRIKARDRLIKRDGYRIARLIQHMPPAPDGKPYTKEMITERFPTILSREEKIKKLRELDIDYNNGIIEMSGDSSLSEFIIQQQFKTIFERQNEFYRLKQEHDLKFPYGLFNELLTEISGYQTILSDMKTAHKVEPTNDSERKAIDQAFWKHIADFISEMEAINPEAPFEQRQYLNIVKFLTRKQVDDLIFNSQAVSDEEWETIETNLIDLTRNLNISNIHQEEEEENDDDEDPSQWISYWFAKLMQCKQSNCSEGKNFIRNRVKNIIGFLKNIDEDKRRIIIEKDIIDNGQNCSDRALSGLDNAEIMIKIIEAKTIPEMLGAIIQKFKKNVLEMILDRGRQEIVEEYLYLAIMFNDYLALGLPTTNITYAHFGNHKTFDEALKKFLEHIHYEGIINVIMDEEVWWTAVREHTSINKIPGQTPEDQRDESFELLESQHDYISANQYNKEMEEIDRVYRKAIEDPIKEFTKQIFDDEFLISFSKYSELNSETAKLLAQDEYASTLKKLKKIRDDAKKSMPPKDRDFFIRSFVDYAAANETLKDYQQRYGHLFPQEIQNDD